MEGGAKALRALLSFSDSSDSALITPPVLPAGCGSIDIYEDALVLVSIWLCAVYTFSMRILVHSVTRLRVGHGWIDKDFVLDKRS